MSAYFTNSYLPDLRNTSSTAVVDPYTGQSTPQSSPDSCDPSILRQVAHYHSSAHPQGLTYPRFPPFDRLEIRPIGGGNINSNNICAANGPTTPAQYYNPTTQQSLSGISSDGQSCRNVSPPDLTPLQHPSANSNTNSSANSHQYNSCKLQQTASQSSPASPDDGQHRSNGSGGVSVINNHNVNNHHANNLSQNSSPQQHVPFNPLGTQPTGVAGPLNGPPTSQLPVQPQQPHPNGHNGISLQSLPDSAEEDRNCSCAVSHRKADKDMVPKQTDEVEKREQEIGW
ncbi:hypothetical protein CHUAL_010315 [Chamberlinius hualienensis]